MANAEYPQPLAYCRDAMICAQPVVSPVIQCGRIGRAGGQTLRYPAGRPIHGFVIAFHPHPVKRAFEDSRLWR